MALSIPGLFIPTPLGHLLAFLKLCLPQGVAFAVTVQPRGGALSKAEPDCSQYKNIKTELIKILFENFSR